MQPFRFSRPQDTATAIKALVPESQAVYVAGGTSLIDLMKLDVQAPSHLIDINNLPLAAVELRADGMRIGALARNSDIAHNPTIRERYPVLSEALLAGASPQLRNMATIGGNLLQRTRCYYFRDVTMPCNKREPGSGCSAINCYNRIHAILGGSEQCIAVNPSDMAVALVALDAVVQIQGPKGERDIPITDFYVLPDEHPERETVLQHGELIIAIDLPTTPLATHSLYIKVRERSSYAFALASVAVALDIQHGGIRDARIVLGGVATIPWRAYTAEQLLIGQPPGVASYMAAADAAVEGAVPRQYNGYKIELTRRTVLRALESLGGRL
jgi:xanthine dehydrogenase YagS FAD-binding subunit